MAVAVAAVGATASPALVEAQTSAVRVEVIRASPGDHVNEVRTVEGVVERLVDRPGSDLPGFYLEDDYGHQILVVPLEQAPERGARLTVTGVVTLDPAGDPVITMVEALGSAVGAPEVDTAVAETSPEALEPSPQSLPPLPEPGLDVPRLLLYGAATVAGLLLALFVFRLLSTTATGPKPLVTGPGIGQPDVDVATSALWPPSDQQFDGRTLKFRRPDPTLQLLPARLEVVGGGDTGEEIRFVSSQGEPVSVMFGRAAGEGPSQVQLKQKTVSRTHAVVRLRDGRWTIENLSLTNPTVLNGEILGVQERDLVDGDSIEMGEVVFRFREA